MDNVIPKEIYERLNTSQGRKHFIDNYESNIYAGRNVDGEKIIVFNEQGLGMRIWTNHKEKPNWYEIAEYDENGYQEPTFYKSVRYTGRRLVWQPET